MEQAWLSNERSRACLIGHLQDLSPDGSASIAEDGDDIVPAEGDFEAAGFLLASQRLLGARSQGNVIYTVILSAGGIGKEVWRGLLSVSTSMTPSYRGVSMCITSSIE